MSTNNSQTTPKIKTINFEDQLIDTTKTTSLRPSRSITPSRSLYRTGVRTAIPTASVAKIEKSKTTN